MKLFYLAYIFLLVSFCIFSFLFIDKNFIYLKDLYSGFSESHREIISVIYLLFIFLFFFCYYFLLKRINLKILKNIVIVTAMILIFAYPAMLSFDIFNYIFTSKVLFFYQENPYIIMPIEFINDPLLNFTRAANKVALYGPLWLSLTGIPFLLSLGNFLIALINFKILVSIFYFAITFLIYKMTKNAYKTAFFALNPLVLIETLVSGHNDVLMMFFALLSIYFLKKEKVVFAIILIFLSILIKYATIFLFPVFVYYFYLKFKKQKIIWEKIYWYSFILMFMIFVLSFIREEIYPWYGIWFLTFVPLLMNKKSIISFSFLISFLLLLRYIPYMYFGDYLRIGAIIKEAITFVPLIIFVFLNKFIHPRIANEKNY